ncbi:MAG: VOC family protein [Variibacter sp.]|nr:VOC family protein [Variibacter sp.]
MPEHEGQFGLTVVTLGVTDFARSVAFYEALGLVRKFRATGDEIAFFEAGPAVLALFRWDALAADAEAAAQPRPQAFRGSTLACNCNSPAEVDAVMARALEAGATLVKPAQTTSYGGYAGYFADPDGHLWEVVQAPGLSVGADGRLLLPD